MPTTTVGVPAEIKDGEHRIALDPTGVHELVRNDVHVIVESNAGHYARFNDEDFIAAGAKIVKSAAEAWSADLVIKVKEPQPSEWVYFRQDLMLFCYLHLAAEPSLADALRSAGTTAYAFETLEDHDGSLPILAPMSEIAGRAAAFVGATELANSLGIMVGGVAGVPPAHALVIGLGTAGTSAARGLRGLDAQVTGVDINLSRLRSAQEHGFVTSTIASRRNAIAEALESVDLVVGAALVPGARAPIVVPRELLRRMKPGSVIIDLAIDQGGCVESSRPTSLSHPTYVDEQIVHYCVTNVPGHYPRSATTALSAALAPYANLLIHSPDDDRLVSARNIAGGKIVHPIVAKALAGS